MAIKTNQVPKKQVASTTSIPAPIGGLNARDNLASMKDSDAVFMENYFPETTSVNVRNGYAEHATGLGANVHTVVYYNDGVSQELFGVAGGSIFDITASGAVGAGVVTGLANSKFQYVNFGTAGGFFLMMVNGQDDLQYYDGTAWSAINAGSSPAITGVNTADIDNINIFKQRIWLIEKDTLNAWYLPVSSIGGAASKIDLSGLFKLGGTLVTMANWTIDNAAGIDDYAAFITSEGEVALYKGTDPSSANTWALVGTFRIGKPIGKKCAIKGGADVLVLTEDGALPLSKSLLTDRGQSNSAVTDKISQLFLEDARSYKSAYGWQPIIHPIGNKMIINVPSMEDSISHQYVMNLITGAWTKFTGWNSFCYEILEDNLYFGGNGTVYRADTGQNDNGSDIVADCQQAFSYFGTKGRQKRFLMARPIFSTEGEITPAIKMNTDFKNEAATSTPQYISSDDSLWNVAPWDTSSWGGGDAIVRNWRSINGLGYSAGIRMKVSANGIGCNWQSTDFVYEVGGIL